MYLLFMKVFHTNPLLEFSIIKSMSPWSIPMCSLENQFASTLNALTKPYFLQRSAPYFSSIPLIAFMERSGVKTIEDIEAYGATVPS